MTLEKYGGKNQTNNCLLWNPLKTGQLHQLLLITILTTTQYGLKPVTKTLLSSG